MIPIIQREVGILVDDVWNSHQIRAQKDTNFIMEYPIIFKISPKNVVFKIKVTSFFGVKDAFLLNALVINFMCWFSLTKKNINLSNYQTHTYQSVIQENSC